MDPDENGNDVAGYEDVIILFFQLNLVESPLFTRETVAGNRIRVSVFSSGYL
jgi:hypothetical protein